MHDPLTIETIARAVLIRAGSILLCRNVKHGYLYLPGGHVEFGERAADAVVRELMEEAGLAVEPRSVILVSEHVFRQQGVLRHELNVVFHVERAAAAGGGGPTDPVFHVEPLEPKIAFDWVPLSGLHGIDLRPGTIASWLGGTIPTGTPATPHWLSDAGLS